MKRCLSCRSDFESSRSACPACEFRPEVIGGFEVFAPELAHESSGFKSEYFADLAELEAANFWFQARNEILTWAIRRYAASFSSLLEIGCGTGFVLSRIEREFPEARLWGSEIFIEGLKFAAKRLKRATLIQMNAREVPFVDEFDVIGAFDVLEHIKEDEAVLSQLHRAARTSGILIITVPQHKWLWSAADEYACHERRYSRSEIEQKVENAGFRVLRSTSFVTSLLPAMMAARLLKGRTPERVDHLDELRLNPVLNGVFRAMLSMELVGMRLGINYPVGGSRLVIAKKV